ncbi:MAG: IS1595 family transposase [Acidobacteriota bacterium]|nr:IS1595 family transposase [Acidobacteriota bacterium]
MVAELTSLQEAIVYFADPANCREYVVRRRWPNGVGCPTCGCKDVIFLATQNRWQCRNKHSKRQFSLKTGTIYEDSPLGLDKWLTATWLVSNCKNGVSSCEVARALNITQKTAWFLDHRIRVSLGMSTPDKFTGEIEADETFIGGKARNMHAHKRAVKIIGTGGKDKTAVMGIIERGKDGTSKIRTTVVPNRKKSALQAEVRKHVEAGSALFTDALKSYEGLSEFEHQVIDHAVAYVDGKFIRNCENFWSLLKRGINGTYVSVEPFHLFRYLDEQAYRYNNRKLSDSERCSIAVSGIVGKRLTFDQLTGKTLEAKA